MTLKFTETQQSHHEQTLGDSGEEKLGFYPPRNLRADPGSIAFIREVVSWVSGLLKGFRGNIKGEKVQNCTPQMRLEKARAEGEKKGRIIDKARVEAAFILRDSYSP